MDDILCTKTDESFCEPEEENQTFSTIVYKDDLLQSYLKGIGKIKLLKQAEEQELGKLISKGDLNAKKKLVKEAQQQFFYKTAFKLAGKLAANYTEEVIEEGVEEVAQNATNFLSEKIADILDQNTDIPPEKARDLLKESIENFKGGVMGSIFLS